MDNTAIQLLRDIKDSQNSFHEQNLKRQDRLEDALSKLAENQSILTVAMGKLEQQQEANQKRQDEQKEIDTLQDHKLEILKDDYHSIDKRVDVAQRQLDILEASISLLESRTSQLEKEQVKDDTKWGISSSVYTKILVPVVLTVVLGLGSFAWFNITG